jgi:hypothetical protein
MSGPAHFARLKLQAARRLRRRVRRQDSVAGRQAGGKLVKGKAARLLLAFTRTRSFNEVMAIAARTHDEGVLRHVTEPGDGPPRADAVNLLAEARIAGEVGL